MNSTINKTFNTVLQNRCSYSIRKFLRKLSSQVVFFNVQYMCFCMYLYPIKVVISLPLWIKLTMGQLLLFFLSNFSSFFNLSHSCPRNQPSSLLLIDRYILAIQQSELPQEPCHHGHKNRKWLKTASKSFSLTYSSQKSTFFAVLIYTRYGHHRYFKFERKYQHTARILPFCFF